MQNADNSTAARYGAQGFQVFDDFGVSHDNKYYLNEVLKNENDVLPGGVLIGKLIFEVPNTGHLTLVYAPYKHNRFADGRLVKWEIKTNPISTPFVLIPEIDVINNSSGISKFQSAYFYIYSNKIFGEMHYVGEKPISLPILTISFFVDDKLVSTQECEVHPHSVNPGEKVIISENLDDIIGDNISKVSLSVTTKDLTEKKMYRSVRKFELDNFQLIPESKNTGKMSGNVKNNWEETVSMVTINVIAYDIDGNIIGFDTGVTESGENDLAPTSKWPIEGSMKIYHPDGLIAIDHFDYILEPFIPFH